MSESGKPQPWRVRKADGTEIRVPTRALLESWILAGVVEPEDKVARPGEDDYVLVRELQDVSEAVETGSVVHGPRTVPTHPPVFAVVDDPKTVPPPVPDQDADVLELEPLEGDTIQDAPVVDEPDRTLELEVAQTRVAAADDDLTAPDYPSESPTDERRPPKGATLDEMLPELASSPQPSDPAPRTGRVAVAPTTLAPLIVEGNYVSDQAVDPSENPGLMCLTSERMVRCSRGKRARHGQVVWRFARPTLMRRIESLSFNRPTLSAWVFLTLMSTPRSRLWLASRSGQTPLCRPLRALQSPARSTARLTRLPAHRRPQRRFLVRFTERARLGGLTLKTSRFELSSESAGVRSLSPSR